MQRLPSSITWLLVMAGKSRESASSLTQVCCVECAGRIQVNHLSAVLLTVLLLPCLLRAASTGTSPNPRIVIVSSAVHHWVRLSKEEVENDKILQKLSDKDYCTFRWAVSLHIQTQG